MPSPEHLFISEQLDISLSRYSRTKLYGVLEAERKTFDYACILDRDFSRPLVAQTLWHHPEGIDKDLRTLLHDMQSQLKVYFFKDSIRHRARIEEVIRSYKSSPLRQQLVGLRLFPVPSDFDADSEAHREWMADFVDRQILTDLLFAVVFGQLTAHDFDVFMRTGGPGDETFAILKLSLSDTSVIRSQNDVARAIHWKGAKAQNSLVRTMRIFHAAGLVVADWDKRRFKFTSTTKGRLLWDLICLLWYELHYLDDWSDETVRILSILGQERPPFVEIYQDWDMVPKNRVLRMLWWWGLYRKSRWGPPSSDTLISPIFYSLGNPSLQSELQEDTQRHTDGQA